jgi:hypothetical protein
MGSVTVIIIVLSVVSLGLAMGREIHNPDNINPDVPPDAIDPGIPLPTSSTRSRALPFASHRASPVVGGGQEEHGCIGSAGYPWCPELNEYI